MAKFVIAGRANCPYLARAELVADSLAVNLPDFKVHKIFIDPSEWNDWLKETCSKNNWKHKQSPIIWRELVDRGGKGMLLGDVNDFIEYAKGYYGISTDLTSDDLRNISSENEKTHKVIQNELKEEREQIKPLIITFTNPESSVMNFMLPEILNGKTFGPKNELDIRLYSESNSDQLQGLKMEIQDLASPKLRYLKISHKPEEAFNNADYIVLLDELIKSESDEDKYLNPYIKLAKQIDQFAKRTCKILITPLECKSETYGLVNVFSPNLNLIDSRKNLIGNSMSEEMIAKSILANRLRVNPAYVKDVILVGQSLTDTFYIDISKAKVTNFDGAVWARKGSHWISLVNMIADKDWIHKDFIDSVHEREHLINDKLKRDGVYTFAQSILKLLHLWSSGEDEEGDGCLYSVIANVNGHYSMEENVYLSLPCKFEHGTFEINDRSYFETNKLIADISQDAQNRVSNRYKEDSYTKIIGDNTLTIPRVRIE